MTRSQALIVLMLFGGTASATATDLADPDAWYPVSVERREPAFNPHGSFTRVDYVPGDGASRPWTLCTSLPGLQFEFFEVVAHGLQSEARRQGVELRLLDAGGFDAVEQYRQFEACLRDGADALIVLSADATVLAPLLEEAQDEGVVVVDLIQPSGSPSVTARIAADHVRVGQVVGDYVVDLHPQGSDSARIAWIPGPAGATFAEAYDLGFRHAITGGAVTLAHAAFVPQDGAGVESAVREALNATDELDMLVGTTEAVRAALDLGEGRERPIALVATAVSRTVIEGIEAGSIAAAVNAKPVTQARIAVDLAVRALDGRPLMAEIRPTLEVIDAGNVASIDRSTAIIPSVRP